MESTVIHPTRTRAKGPVKKSQTQWSSSDDKLLLSLLENNEDPVWETISSHFPNKTTQQVSDRWNKVLNPDLIKGSWSPEEDAKIIQWVSEKGPKNWSALASYLPGRLGKQCRERWINSLDPDLLRKPWTEKEDSILIEHQKLWGNKWAKIATLLPGRTDNSVKNRWNSSLKRKLDRIAKGEDPVQKRGRKPKRPSNAPSLAEAQCADSAIPRPDFGATERDAVTALELPPFSPILAAESPFAQMSPIKSISCPSPTAPFSLFSPTQPFLLRSPGEAFSLQSPIKMNFEISEQIQGFECAVKKEWMMMLNDDVKRVNCENKCFCERFCENKTKQKKLNKYRVLPWKNGKLWSHCCWPLYYGSNVSNIRWVALFLSVILLLA